MIIKPQQCPLLPITNSIYCNYPVEARILNCVMTTWCQLPNDTYLPVKNLISALYFYVHKSGHESFSVIGQCIIARIQSRIQSLSKRLRWIISQKNFTIFSRYLLLRKAPPRILTGFWIHLWNMPILFLLFRISLTVIQFKSLCRRFEWIPGNGKVGLMLNHIKLT